MRVSQNQVTLLAAAVCALFACAAQANVHPPTEKVQVVHVVAQDVSATPAEVLKVEQATAVENVAAVTLAVAQTPVPAAGLVQTVSVANGVVGVAPVAKLSRWRS